MIRKMLISLLLVGSVLQFAACDTAKAYNTTDPKEYLQTTGHIENEGLDIKSGLFIFPETVDGIQDVEYRYSCEEGTLDNSYFIFLRATYSEEAYREEIERLENIRCTVELPEDTVEKSIEYSETLFRFPAYVAVYNANMSFEYALADEENNCIRYVYLKLYEGSDYLPEEYLPLEFKGKSMLNYDTTWQNQNIYYATDVNGDHTYFLD